MAWTFEQQIRLQQERQIINRYLYSFNIYWNYPTIPGSANIEIDMRTNSSRIYKLRLVIPNDLPNSVPDLYVITHLRDFYNNNFADIGVSSRMHTLEPKNGNVKICHYRSSNWTPNVTFYKVFMKARIWLEAYESYLRTGNDIEHYLKHQ